MITDIADLEQQTASATILYVDDEEFAQKYFRRAFGANYEVLTASDVDTALEILRDATKKIDIVVTDYRMPVRDGGDLLRHIELDLPHIIRIVVTAYANKDVLLNTLNSGKVFRVLEKPLNIGDIHHVLRQAHELLQDRRVKQQRLKVVEGSLDFLLHELNTPLAAISNFSHAIQQRVTEWGLSPQQHTELVKAAQAIDGHARFSHTLLASFFESVKSVGGFIKYGDSKSAYQMVSYMLDTYPITPAQRAIIRIETREDFQITAILSCMELVLSSLLANALRALRNQPDPMICFTLLVEGNPQIRITDNGHGIPHETMARLLVEPTTTYSDTGGNGFGLIFCERVMQSFGGSIQIHSVPNDHTTVTLNFPAIAINDKFKRNNQ